MAVDQSTVYLVMMAIVGLTMLLASIFCKDNKKGINHVNHCPVVIYRIMILKYFEWIEESNIRYSLISN